MATASDWLTELRPHFPGCFDMLIEDHVRNTAEDFCRKTWAWRYDHADITLVEGQGEYDLTLPSDSVCIGLLSAFEDNIKLNSTTQAWLESNYPGWDSEVSVPSFVFLPDMETVRVVPAPGTAAAGDSLKLRLALVPSRDAATLPAFLYNDHFETIKAGTILRLGAIPGKQWSGLNDLNLWGATYRRGVSVTKRDLALDPSHGGLTQRDYFA